MDRVLQQLGALWGALTGAQRIALGSMVLITLGTLALLVNLAGQPSWGTLFAELSPEDASKIVDELETQQVPFKLTHAGTAIQVPAERIYDLRMELAAGGLPSSGSVGFEVFDESELGLTPFQQRVRFRRALEGELGRTISRLAPVQWARVHINLPEKSVFRRNSKEASAAVVVSLLPGRDLDATEARGIAHLISGAVDGLGVSQVAIVDAAGRMLMRPDQDDGDALASSALDVRRGLERELAGRAQSLLDAALGSGRSVVTVSATVDRRRVEETQERVNPNESAVLSEQRVEETRSEPGGGAGGVPGARSNVPPGGGESAGGQASETITRETINFEVTRTNSHTVVPIGSLQKLSVAVMVDGTYSVPDVADGAPAAEPIYEPRTPEALSQLAEIVKRAVGFDASRGDQIEIQNFAFRSPLADLPVDAPAFWQSPELFALLPWVTRMLAVIGGVLLLVFLVVRPTLRQLSSLPGIPTTAAGGEAALPAGAGAGAEGTPAAELAIPISKDQAKQVAEAMKQWLRE